VRFRAIHSLIFSILVLPAHADSILGTAGSFGVLGGSTVTNTGASVVTGNVGVSPGSAITGFPPGTATGSIYNAGGVAAQAQTDASAAYSGLAGMAVTDTLTGTDLGGLTLTPGVYEFASSAQLTGALILDGEGNDNALWVFLVGSTLNTASGSSVSVIRSGANDGIFWGVGSSATLGTATAFEGNILASTSITLDTGATIGCGSALASTGAVTMDTNTISTGCNGGGTLTNGVITPLPSSTSTVPEPASIFLFGSGLVSLAGWRGRRASK
jgi:hypothetical protein